MTSLVSDCSRPPGKRRGVSVVAVAVLVMAIVCVLVVPAEAAGYRVPASQPLVVLLGDHVARARPSPNARRIESVNSRRPLTGVRTVLPVLGRTRSGSSWVRVRLPGRPNSHTGWISTDHTRNTFTQWHIWVKLSARRVTIYHDGRIMRRFRAVVGKPSTPTPRASSSSRRPLRSLPEKPVLRLLWPAAPDRTSFRNSTVVLVRSRSTAPTTSGARSERRPHTAASGLARAASHGWQDASAAECR